MEKKVAIITGASSGIGEALAYQFGKEGFRLLITGTNEKRINTVSNNLKKYNIDHKTLIHDVSIENDNKKMVDFAIKSFGRIDVLICNAGISIRSLFENVDLKIFKKLFSINFFGAIYGTKFSLPYLEKTKGTIIAMSSLNGFIATPTRSAYVASKHAMQGFYDSLRLELLNKEINVMVISPGYVKSNFRLNTLKSDGKKEGPSSRDSKKMMDPEFLAKKIFIGYSKKKRNMIFTFRGKLAHLIKNWFPRLSDKLAYKEILNEKESLLKSN